MMMPMGRSNDQFYQSSINDDEEGEIATNPPQPSGPPPMTHPRMQGKTCHRCGGVGHFARDCPSSRDNRTCRVCGEVGHIAKDCPMYRGGGPPPSSMGAKPPLDRDTGGREWEPRGPPMDRMDRDRDRMDGGRDRMDGGREPMGSGRGIDRDRDRERDRERFGGESSHHVESSHHGAPIRKSFSHERWGGRGPGGPSHEDGELPPEPSPRGAPPGGGAHQGRPEPSSAPVDLEGRPPSGRPVETDTRYGDRDRDRVDGTPIGTPGLVRFASAPPGPTVLDDLPGSHAAGASTPSATPGGPSAKKGGWGGGLGGKAASASKGAWGKGLARSKSATPAVGALLSNAEDSNPPFDQTRKVPTPFQQFDDASNPPPLPGGPPPPGQEIRRDIDARTPPPDWEDPAVRAARAAEAKADFAARRELVDDLSKRKSEIMSAMETTDAEIEKLELEIAELDERDVNDKEQAEEQARHQEARLDRELDNLKRSVERAELNEERAAVEAEEAKAKAEKLRKKAGLNKEGKLDPAAAAEAKARSKRCAEMIQEMLSGDEPRSRIVERVVAKNERTANKSHDGLKHTCGLPLAREVTRVSVEDVAARNFAAENDSSRFGVRESVKNVLRKRRDAVADKRLTLAVTYLKRREKWRVRMVAADRTRLEKMYGIKPGGKLPTPGVRGSGRLNSGMAGVAKSDYEEMQILQQLQRVEALKSIIKLPPQVLDPEERRLSAFRSRNALVEDPLAEKEALKLVRPWTETEKKIFHEKFASFGKNFKRIATHIDGRTTSDCVVYYYQRQKTDDGFKGRRRALAKKKRAYAEAKKMTGGAWSNNAASQAQQAAQQRAQREAQRREIEDQQEAERKARAEKRKAARQGGKTPKSAKKSKVAEPEPASDDDDSKPISRSASEADLSTKGQSWTAPEKKAFLAALAEHGKDFKAIAAAVGSKSQTAAKAYFGKHKKSLGLEKIVKDHATAKAKVDKRKEAKKGAAKGAAAKEEPAEKPATPAPDESGDASGDASGAAQAAAAAAMAAYQQAIAAGAAVAAANPMLNNPMLQAMMPMAGAAGAAAPDPAAMMAMFQQAMAAAAAGGAPAGVNAETSGGAAAPSFFPTAEPTGTKRGRDDDDGDEKASKAAKKVDGASAAASAPPLSTAAAAAAAQAAKDGELPSASLKWGEGGEDAGKD